MGVLHVPNGWLCFRLIYILWMIKYLVKHNQWLFFRLNRFRLYQHQLMWYITMLACLCHLLHDMANVVNILFEKDFIWFQNSWYPNSVFSNYKKITYSIYEYSVHRHFCQSTRILIQLFRTLPEKGWNAVDWCAWVMIVGHVRSFLAQEVCNVLFPCRVQNNPGELGWLCYFLHITLT